MTATRSTRIWARVVSVAFVAGLALPTTLLVTGHGDVDQVAFEYRLPAAWPQLSAAPASWAAWPSGFGEWFGDRFGLRSTLLTTRARVHWFGLGHSPATLVERGEDGWMFTTAMRVLDAGAGRTPLSDREVDEWVDAIERRSNALASRGIVHVVAFAPDKDAIYPERLHPRYLPRAQRRVEQVAARARERGLRGVLDLTEPLRAARLDDTPGDAAYFPLGDHWTTRGAHAAAEAICERLTALGARPALPGREHLRRAPSTDQGDTLATRLYLGDLLLQRFSLWSFEGGHGTRLVASDGSPRTEVFARDVDAPRALVFHDSFGVTMKGTLSPAFRRTTWCWRRYDERTVDSVAPDVVVEVFVERVLFTSLPARNDPCDQGALAGRFEELGAPVLALGPDEVGSRIEPNGPAGLRAAAEGGEGPALALAGAGGGFVLDLAGLEPGRDHLVRVTGRSSAAGAVKTHYSFTNGSPAYPTAAGHRADYVVPQGPFTIHVHVGRQRSSDRLTIASDAEPSVIVVRTVEARAMPDGPGAVAPTR